MMKGLLVFAMLLVACSAHSADVKLDVKLYGKCLGMADSLSLPDKNVFSVLFQNELIQAKRNYGEYSKDHVNLLVEGSNAVGFGSGYMKGFVMGQGTETAFKAFTGYCWNYDYAARDRAIEAMK